MVKMSNKLVIIYSFIDFQLSTLVGNPNEDNRSSYETTLRENDNFLQYYKVINNKIKNDVTS